MLPTSSSLLLVSGLCCCVSINNRTAMHRFTISAIKDPMFVAESQGSSTHLRLQHYRTPLSPSNSQCSQCKHSSDVSLHSSQWQHSKSCPRLLLHNCCQHHRKRWQQWCSSSHRSLPWTWAHNCGNRSIGRLWIPCLVQQRSQH